MPAGRKSIYDTRIKPYLSDIKNAFEAGATVEEIAKGLDISLSTFNKYKAEKKELSNAFMRSREKIVFEIKSALLKKALGFEYTEEKRVGRKDKNGENIVAIEKYTRYCVPSETAANMLLRNYDKKWRENDDATATLKKQELALKKAIAESTNFDLKVEDEEK